MRSCISIRGCVRPSVCPSVHPSVRPSHTSWSHVKGPFLGATKHFYKRVYSSIRPSIHPSVCRSVRRSVTPSLQRQKKVFRSTLCHVSGLVILIEVYQVQWVGSNPKACKNLAQDLILYYSWNCRSILSFSLPIATVIKIGIQFKDRNRRNEKLMPFIRQWIR